jgi:WD40 repeat protein
MSDVFISYSRKDSEFVRTLNEALENSKRETWVDWEGIAKGTEWWKEIEEGIEGADTFVFVISPDSVASEVCQKEINHAKNYNKQILPIVYRDADKLLKKENSAHQAISSHNWLFFRETDDFEKSFKELIDALNLDIAHVKGHTRLLVRALEWNNKGRKGDVLLRGEELNNAENWLKAGVDKEPKPIELQQHFIQKSRKQEIIILWSLLVGTSVVLITVFGGTIFALNKMREADLNLAISKSQNALALFNEGKGLGAFKELDAFGEAIKAGNILQKQQATDPVVINALRKFLSEAHESHRLKGHQDIVHYINYSPDGRTLATRDDSGTLKLWDLFTGKELDSLTDVRDQSFSSDGTTLAVATSKRVDRREVMTGKPIVALTGHLDWVNSVSYSLDGKTIATASADKTVKLWDVETGQELKTLKGHQGSVDIVRYSPDGKTLASASADNTVKLWDVETGNELKTIKVRQAGVTIMRYSPDGKTLATQSEGDSGGATINLWDLATGKEIATFDTFQLSDVRENSFSFSSNGKILAIVAVVDSQRIIYNKITLWDISKRQALKIDLGKDEHKKRINSVRFSPDGKLLVTGDESGMINLFRIDTNDLSDIAYSTELVATLRAHEAETLTGDVTDGISSIQFSPNGKSFATAGSDNMVKLWNLETEKRQEFIQLPSSYSNSFNIKISSDSKTLAIVTSSQFEDDSMTFEDDNTNIVTLLDMKTKKELHPPFKGGRNKFYSVSYSPDGKTLASASADKTVKLWDVTTGKNIGTIKGFQDKVYSVNYSPDGRTLATASLDKTVKLWDVATGKELKTLKEHQDGVYHVSYAPDGKTLASASWDKTVKLWDLETGKSIKTLKLPQEESFIVEFSPDQKFLAFVSANGKEVKLWDMATDKEIYTLKGHRETVNSVSYSSDGKTLATGSADKTVKLWDVVTGKELYTLKGYENGLDDGVTSVGFSPDGNTLVSARGGGQVIFWNFDLDKLMQEGCNWIGAYLSSHPEETELQQICQPYLTGKSNPKP